MKKQWCQNCPEEYVEHIENAINLAKNIFKNNLQAIFLAGSVPKGNCIKGWSDIDIYIITKNLNLKSNKEFFRKTRESKIHIGTTFYTIDMINNLILDQKTMVAFYEYHYFKVNEVIYGKQNIPNITYDKLLITENSLNDMIQIVQRELYNYEIDKKNFKTLLKKTILLMKIYLNVNYHNFSFGYNNVLKSYKDNVDNNVDYDIIKLIETNDKNNELIKFVHQILEGVIERMMVK